MVSRGFCMCKQHKLQVRPQTIGCREQERDWMALYDTLYNYMRLSVMEHSE